MPEIQPAQATTAGAWGALRDAGAHLVLHRDRDGWQHVNAPTPPKRGEPKAAFATGWKSHAAPSATLVRHVDRGGLVGVLPASLSLVCIDVDHNPDGMEADELRRALDNKLGSASIAMYPSLTPGHFHVWYPGRTVALRHWRWMVGSIVLGGEIRSGLDTSTIVYRPDLLAEGLKLDRTLNSEARTSALPTKPKAAKGSKGAVNIQDADWGEGSRNATLNDLAFRLAKLGQLEARREELRSKAIDAGLPPAEVDKTIASAAKAGDKARADILPWDDHRALKQSLEALGYKWRLNERRQDIEFQNGTGGWASPDDADEAYYRACIREKFEVWQGQRIKPLSFTKAAYDEYLQAIAKPTRCDPFMDWVDSLEPWDGTPRLDCLLPTLWDCDIKDPLVRWAGGAPLIGAIRRAREPGAPLKAMVVLVGAQGIGKSPFLEYLFPKAERAVWFDDSLRFGETAQRQIESMLGRVLVEASELVGVRKADLATLKAFLSRKDDGGTRLAYAARAKDLPRRCVLVGTANDDGTGVLPNDGTGNTRFVAVKLGAAWDAVEPHLDTEREQLWAEAKHREAEGEDGQLPRELRGLADIAAERVRTRPAWEYVADDIPYVGASIVDGEHRRGMSEGVSLTDLQRQYPALGRASHAMLGPYLELNGWERGAGRARRLLYHPDDPAN